MSELESKIKGVIIKPLSRVFTGNAMFSRIYHFDDKKIQDHVVYEIDTLVLLPTRTTDWNLRPSTESFVLSPVGETHLYLYDPVNKIEDTFKVGERNYIGVLIPNNIWSAFQCISKVPAYIVCLNANMRENEHPKTFPYNLKQIPPRPEALNHGNN